jgi:hypothetical protein
MALIIDFPAHRVAPAPAAPAAAPALPATGGRRCEYAVGDLARMLGIAHFSPRTIIDLLRAKARDQAMPLPKTPRLRCGKLVAGPQSIWLHSRWDAERFDGWKAESDGDGPCPPASNALRAELARRAEAIGTPRKLGAR